MAKCRRDIIWYDGDVFRYQQHKGQIESLGNIRFVSGPEALEDKLMDIKPDLMVYFPTKLDKFNLPKIKESLSKQGLESLQIIVAVSVESQGEYAEYFINNNANYVSPVDDEAIPTAVMSVLMEIDSMPQLLIVERDEDELRRTMSVLGDAYNCIGLIGGDSALEELRSWKPDLVFTDINLGEMTGLELCDRIRELEGHEKTQIAFFTEESDRDTVMKVLQKKAAGYILKPVGPDELRIKVKSIFDKINQELNTKTILMVDDDPIILKTMQSILKSDYKTVGVNSVDQALKFVEKVVPDIVLLDYEMPVKNGLFLLRRLRLNPAFNNVPIIMLTGNKDKEVVMESIQSGAQGYLTKPVNPISLKLRVRQYIGEAEKYKDS